MVVSSSSTGKVRFEALLVAGLRRCITQLLVVFEFIHFGLVRRLRFTGDRVLAVIRW
jgi:hypothetical protein